MRFILFVSLFAAVGYGFEFPSFDHGTVRGSIIVSPAELQAFEVHLAPATDCEKTALSDGGITKCNVDGVTATFSSAGKEKATAVFRRSVGIQSKIDFKKVDLYSHTFAGTWTSSKESGSLTLPFSITFVLRSDEEGQPFSGYIDMGQGTRLYLKAHLE